MTRAIALFITTILASTTCALASPVTDRTKLQTVIVANTKDNLRALGSGVIIGTTKNGLRILCAAHTTAFGGTLTVTTSDGQTLNLSERPQLIEGHDLAILTTSMPHGIFHAATLGSPDLTAGALHVWGHAGGALYTLSAATIQDLAPKISDNPHSGEFAIHCDTCTVGDSGSGVFDADGHLVGIVTGAIIAESGAVLMTVAESVSPLLTIIAPQSVATSTPR